MIALPPLNSGVVQETATDALPAIVETLKGASATAAGTTAGEIAEVVLSPTAFVAMTTKVYETPFAKPVKVYEVWLVRPVYVTGAPGARPLPVQVAPVVRHDALAMAFTVYPVTSLPPVDVGGLKKTVAEPSPPAATTLVGALGAVIGVTFDEATEGALEPLALTALTVKV